MRAPPAAASGTPAPLMRRSYGSRDERRWILLRLRRLLPLRRPIDARGRAKLPHDLEEGVGELWVEHRPAALVNHRDRGVVAERAAIRAMRRERVVAVGDRENARADGNVVAAAA